MIYNKLYIFYMRALCNEIPVFFSRKWMFSTIFCLFCACISAQSLDVLVQKMDTISTLDLDYEKTLKEYIARSKAQKKDSLLFDGYLRAIKWYNDSLVRNSYYDSAHILLNRLDDNIYKIKFYQTRSYVAFVERKYLIVLDNQLKAFALIDKNTEPYLYYKSLYSIGATKLYMANYVDALKYFEEASTHFKSQTDLSHVKGYLNSVRSQAICNYYLNNYNEAEKLLQLGRKSFHYLDKGDHALEKAYFNLTEAMVTFSKQNYKQSLQLLNDALPEIVSNEDFANENLVYFYLGKNYWELNNKELAITYFNKIDDLFTNKEYINVHFLKAYSYLIDYYKQENNIEKQLYYTNRLLIATQNFQKTQSYLSDFFHTEFDTKLLVAEKVKLEEQIAKKHYVLVLVSVVGILILVLFLVLAVRNKRKEKEYKKRYKTLLQQIEHRKVLSKKSDEFLSQSWITLGNEHWNSYVFSDDVNLTTDLKVKKESLPNELITELNVKLTCFENQKLFLKPDITLNDLADYCKTNRSYLSQFINQVKEKSFPDYINSLRIHLLLDDLQIDSQLKRYKTEVIAERYGYTNRRSFSNAFLKVTGISYSYFLQELEKEQKS